MYLKSIKAQGFKSFADKLDLEINPGITGIVGPNGSGKSNIVDAVRWVLGEQSAKSLRSNAMSDVIFNGSSSREAQKRAYVALVFDNTDHYLNSDFKEIEVKRVVYSSGENEYFLNNVRVRLKDVTDLFIESGAGSNDFNIISQGNVTDIVNSKSSDRRVIFEATARVLKYKKRKEESLKKLEKTEENLLRIGLVIKELETTIKPLKKQSEAAQRHLELKKELEDIDIALICEDINTLNNEYQTLKKEIEVYENDLLNFKKISEDPALEKLKLQNLNLDDKINKLHQELLDLTQKLSNLNSEKQLTIERQKYNSNQDSLNENLVRLKEETLNLTKNLEVMESEIMNLNSTLNNLKESKEEVSDELLKDKVKLTTKQNELMAINKEIFNIQNKIEILENNIASDASFPLPIRSILSNPRLKGIHNTIASLIKTKNEYLLALDVALGYNKNFIVVDDETSAIAAINYLKENKLGRATFYPLNVIKGRKIDENVLTKIQNETGFIDILNNLVEYDSKYQNIIENQLGNIIVIDKKENLKEFGKLVNYKYKIVTLDGEIQNVGGSITGGTIKSNSLALAKNELNKLKENLTTYNIEYQSLIENISNLQKSLQEKEEKENEYLLKINLLNEQIKQKEDQKEEINQNLYAKQSELDGIESLKENTLEKKLLALLEEINIVAKNKELKEKEIKSLTQEKEKITDDILTLEKKLKENNSLLNEKQNELNNKEVLLGKTEVKLDNLLVNLNEEYNLTYEYASKNYTLELDYNIALEKVNSLKKELNKIGEVNIGAISEYERLNKRYEFLTNQKEDLEKASGELKDIITQMDEIMINKFSTTFKEVKTEFARIFKMMFKGGHGELKLTNPDDLLNTGIEIIAIPPGKKVSSPLSLSGGEKALTAICLLFAMLEVRPSPFIILDEAEAALDEANVDMLGKYLNEEKKKSQFILITHKKRMMEYADCLYGITMQESGVSKIVSTKLEN